MRDVQLSIDANLNEVAEDSIVDKLSERFSSSFLRRQGEFYNVSKDNSSYRVCFKYFPNSSQF